MKQYSRDLRERSLPQVDAGRPVGEVAPRSRPGRSPVIGPLQQPLLLAQRTARPDAALAERCAARAAETGVAVSASTMCRALGRLGRPLKKSG
jgi:transposase